MPQRVIRGDELLESERYMRQPVEVQLFFMHAMLLADDFGLVLLTEINVCRRFYMHPISSKKIQKLIDAVVAADLIRTYEFEGLRYGFIPRFRQRMDRYRAKCPMPPPELFEDDEHARKKINENKEHFIKFATIRREPTHMGNQLPHISKERDSDPNLKRRHSEVPLPPVADAAPEGADAAGNPIEKISKPTPGNLSGYLKAVNQIKRPEAREDHHELQN